MASWIFIVESNCIDPTREKEFNDWYNNVHVPDIMSTKYVKKADRYELTTPPGKLNYIRGLVDGRGKYIAVYEIETDDIEATMAAFGEKMSVIAKGRMSSLMKATCRGVYKKIASSPK